MKTIAPLQVMNLVTSLVAVFLVSSFAWFLASFFAFGQIRIYPVVIGANVVMTGLLGWWFYRTRYHTVLSWDEQGFELTKGRGRKRKENWGDYSRVSLVHEGYGKFSVRLYAESGEHLDIPVSALKLPAQEFRFQAMDWVKGKHTADLVSEAK